MSGQQTAGNGASVAAAEQAALLRYSNAAACAIREAGLQQGGGGGGGEMMVATGGAGADVTHVLSSLQQSSAEESSALVNSVLTQQPVFTTEELSGVMDASGVMTADPESLRFQYPLDEPPVAPKKKTTPTVYREQDRFLPINNVSRVMRNAIPRTGKVSKDAKECMQECVSEFVSFITSEAADRCSQEKRKTLTGDDILYAMATLGFDNYIQPMKFYLQKIREYTKVEKVAPMMSRERPTQPQVTTPPFPEPATLVMQTLQPPPSLPSQFTPLP